MGEASKLYEHYPFLEFATCFGNTTLHQLRALELESFGVHCVRLAEFLARRHALENLTLTYLFHTAGEYALFVEELRRRAVVLKHCMFRVEKRISAQWSSGKPESAELVKYLQHGGRNPCQVGYAGDADENENDVGDGYGRAAPLTSLKRF